MAGLKLIVVTPEKTALDQDATFVVVPMFDGEFGIGSGHSPMIGRLGFGEMRVTSTAGVQRYYVDGGFVQVVGDVITVLTGRLVKNVDVDIRASKHQLDAAMQRPVNTEELLLLRDRAVEQARAQIRVAERAKA